MTSVSRRASTLLFALAALLVGAAPHVGASAPQSVAVAIVVERPNHDAVVRVVHVPRGSSAAVVLATLSTEEGWSTPVYDTSWSGFLCAIDGRPSPAPTCLSSFNPHAPTWAFWLGHEGTWTYATSGITSVAATDHQVEGWRLEPGTATFGHVAAPSTPASFTALAASVTPLEHGTTEASSGTGLVLGVGLVSLLGCTAVVLRRRRR